MNYLSDAQKAREHLQLIRPNLVTNTAVLGSLVKTDSLTFFIATSIGKVEIESNEYYIISLQSPIGQMLKFKAMGYQFEINNKKYTITEVL